MMDQFKNTKPLRLGFIGGGLSSAAGMTHFSACRLDGVWALDAGAFSRNKQTNRLTAKEWGVSSDRLYDDWREMVDYESSTLDAISILTHTPLHAEVIAYILDKGLPIISEKSITMNVAEVDWIEKKWNPKKHFIASIFNYTGYPLIRELRERISQGEFGTIQQVHLEMPQEGFVRPPPIAGKKAPPQTWRLTDGAVPTIALDLGVHMHNLITFLTGEQPSEVMAEGANYSDFKGLVDYLYLMLRFQSGMKGAMWMTKTAVGHRNGLKVRVYGDKGSACWYQMSPEELQVNSTDGGRRILDRGSESIVAGAARYNRMKAGHPAGFIEAFSNLYSDIADALYEFKQDGAWSNPYVYGLIEGKNGLKLFEAAAKSCKSGLWVPTEI